MYIVILISSLNPEGWLLGYFLVLTTYYMPTIVLSESW